MIREFENYLRSIRGYSENTIRAYMSDLKNFVLWVRTHKEGATWSTITREDIDEYMTEQTRRELRPSTINRMLASVGALYKYMQREGYEVENPCKYESRKKMPTTIPDTIPVKKIAQAYKHARGVKKHMLGILATTGLRIQEMLDIRYEDIDFESNTIKVTGKGSKEDW
jgi:Site-specific recombinase XerD